MVGLTYLPSPPLSDFVACIWFQENYLPPHPYELALPDGSIEVVIRLREAPRVRGDQRPKSPFDQAGGSLVYGPRTDVFLIDTATSRSILGIHFKPGGAFPFLGFPADELHNLILPLELLWGKQAQDLQGSLLSTCSVTEQFQLLEACLTDRLYPRLTRHPAVDYALRLFQSPLSAPRVIDLLDQIGLSSRRFSQLFREQVGMTPKTFHRLCRFQHTVQLIFPAEQIDSADVALACGYFDQAHFIHDFKAFSGLTPLEYHHQEGKRPGHVPVTS